MRGYDLVFSWLFTMYLLDILFYLNYYLCHLYFEVSSLSIKFRTSLNVHDDT